MAFAFALLVHGGLCMLVLWRWHAVTVPPRVASMTARFLLVEDQPPAAVAEAKPPTPEATPVPPQPEPPVVPPTETISPPQPPALPSAPTRIITTTRADAPAAPAAVGRAKHAPAPAPAAPRPPAAASGGGGGSGAGETTLAHPRYATNPPPNYPPEARRLRQMGEVLLRVKVGADGSAQVVTLKRSSGFPALDDAALAAVRRWKFEPARSGGVAVAAEVDVPVRFQLR